MGDCKETVGRRLLPGCKHRFRNVARWWGNGANREQMEVDVVAESTDGGTLLVGECKLKLTDIEARHELSELKKKALLLPFATNYKRVLCRLFVAENPRPGELGMDWVMGGWSTTSDNIRHSHGTAMGLILAPVFDKIAIEYAVYRIARILGGWAMNIGKLFEE